MNQKSYIRFVRWNILDSHSDVTSLLHVLGPLMASVLLCSSRSASSLHTSDPCPPQNHSCYHGA